MATDDRIVTHKPLTGHPVLGQPVMLRAWGIGAARCAMLRGWRLVGVRVRPRTPKHTVDDDHESGAWLDGPETAATAEHVAAGDVEWWLAHMGKDGEERTIIYSARYGWSGRQE